MNMQKHLAIPAAFALICALAGCCSEAPTSNQGGAGVDVRTTALIRLEGRIENNWLEAQRLERLKNISVKADLDRYPTNFSQIQGEAEKIKNSICSDREYLKALQTFATIASNRVEAIEAEYKVYSHASEPTM